MYIYMRIENRTKISSRKQTKRAGETCAGKKARERLCLRMYNNYIKKKYIYIYINNINNINVCVRCVVQNEEGRK